MSESAATAAMVAIVVLVVAAARRSKRDAEAAPQRDRSPLTLVGPPQARGQAALTTPEHAPEPGEDVRVDGRDWVVSESEDLAGDRRVWLVPAPTPERRQVLDAQVKTLAAELAVDLERVAYAALATLSDVPYTPDLDDVATWRVREALRREADYLAPWLVRFGVLSSADLPGPEWLPVARHVGGGAVECQVGHLAQRIAESYVYG